MFIKGSLKIFEIISKAGGQIKKKSNLEQFAKVDCIVMELEILWDDEINKRNKAIRKMIDGDINVTIITSLNEKDKVLV